MSDTGILPARFTISEASKQEIVFMRAAWDEHFPDDPADVVTIAWAQWRPFVGEPSWGVLVSFYGRSQRAEIAHGVQQVSGLPIVFFTTPLHVSRFEGKVVDFDLGQGFFLRGS